MKENKLVYFGAIAILLIIIVVLIALPKGDATEVYYTVDITEQNINLNPSDTYQLAFAEDVAEGSISEWSSEDQSVVTVSEQGLVTAIAEGTAVVSLTNGEATDFVVVQVSAVTLTYALQIEEASKILEIDDTYQLSLSLDVPTGSTTTWASSDVSVVTVSDQGLVTAISDGIAVVTAVNGTASDYVVIKVNPEVFTYILDITETVTNLDITDTHQLNVTTDVPEGSTTLWASSDESVATVSQSGLVTAVADGIAIITATNGTATDYTVVEINPEAVVQVVFIDMKNDTQEILAVSDTNTVVFPDDPTFDGYTFGGWYTSLEDMTSEVLEGQAIDSNLYVYAYYQSDVIYTVNFNTNGGDADLDSLDLRIGDVVTLPDPGSRDDFEFSAWRYAYDIDTNMNITFETAHVGDEILVTGDMLFFASYTYIVPVDAFDLSLEQTNFGNDYGYVIQGLNDVNAFSIYLNSGSLTSITLPDSYQGYPIVGIEYAFADDYFYFDDVIVPESYLFIGEEAFIETSIQNLYLPASLRLILSDAFADSFVGNIHFAENSNLVEITSSAFENATGFTTLELPDSVQIIDSYAFADTQLEKVTIGENSRLYNIGYSAFYNTNIASINLPEGLLIIQSNAFESTLLREVTIPSTVISIGDQAFYNNYLETLNLSNAFNTDGSRRLLEFGSHVVNEDVYPHTNDMIIFGGFLLADYDENIAGQDIVLPEGITWIGRYAFENVSMNTLTFSETLDKIDYFAFEYAQFGTRIDMTFPASLTTIGRSAFQYATFISGSTLATDANVEQYAFRSTVGLTEVTFLDNTHESIQYAYDAFYGSSVEIVNVGEGITKIPGEFIRYGQVVTVNLPSTITYIDGAAFNAATLENLNVNGTLYIEYFSSDYNVNYQMFDFTSPYITNQTITDGYYTFFNVLYRYSLSNQDFTVPTGVDYIATGAVLNTQNSYDISGAKTVDRYAFVNVADGTVVTTSYLDTEVAYNAFGKPMYSYYTTAQVDYQFTDMSSAFLDAPASIVDGVLRYDYQYDHLVNYLSNATVTPDAQGFKIIGNYIVGFEAPVGFDGNITIPEGIVYIYQYAFYQKGVTSVTFPSTLEFIGYGAFMQNNLTTLTLNEGLLGLANSVFYQNQIASLSLPSTIEYVGQNAFSNNQITTLTIPASVLYLDYSAFGENPIASVTFNDPTNLMQTYEAFDTPAGTTDFYVIDGVLMSVEVFDYEDFWFDIVIPEGVEVILEGAFDSDMRMVVLPESLTYIGREAFRYDNVYDLTFKSNDVVVADGAFDQTFIHNVHNLPDGLDILDMQDPYEIN